MKDKLDAFVGKKAVISAGGLRVEVIVKDVKNSYGRDRFLVSPVSGSGEVWTESIVLV